MYPKGDNLGLQTGNEVRKREVSEQKEGLGWIVRVMLRMRVGDRLADTTNLYTCVVHLDGRRKSRRWPWKGGRVEDGGSKGEPRSPYHAPLEALKEA